MIDFLIDYYAPLSKLPATYWWMLAGAGVMIVVIVWTLWIGKSEFNRIAKEMRKEIENETNLR